MIKRILLLLLVSLFPCFVMAESILKLEVSTQKGKGVIVIKLLSDIAPNHVQRIKTLVQEGAYDNVAFHRVIGEFMAQTGDVKYGNRKRFNDKRVGTGGSDYPDLIAELSKTSFKAGVVAMARSRYINSANSQFFIMTGFHPNLNGRYSAFGVVTEGMNIVNSLKAGSQNFNQGKVSQPDYIIKATIVEN